LKFIYLSRLSIEIAFARKIRNSWLRFFPKSFAIKKRPETAADQIGKMGVKMFMAYQKRGCRLKSLVQLKG
jgi:hypothetical protein